MGFYRTDSVLRKARRAIFEILVPANTDFLGRNTAFAFFPRGANRVSPGPSIDRVNSPRQTIAASVPDRVRRL